MLYIILERNDIKSLQESVQEHSDEGWNPCGGPFTYSYVPGHGPVAAVPQNHPQTDGWVYIKFCQAMTSNS